MFLRAINFIVLCICFQLGIVSFVMADTQNSYTNFQFGEIQNVKGFKKLFGPATRIVVETSNNPESRIFLLENPYRLVIDTAHAEWGSSILKQSGNLSIGPIDSYRYGKPDQNTGRLVFELSQPAAPISAFLITPQKNEIFEFVGYKIVIDILDRGKTAFSLARAALQKTPYLANNEIDTIIQNQIINYSDNLEFKKLNLIVLIT